MGRPKISEESRRAINFTIRLTPDEQKKLEKAAEVCGKTPAVIVRAKLFKGKFPVARTPRIELNTYLELKKIGTNLNQVTKLANAGKISKFFNQVLTQLLKQQQTIIDQIINDSDSENR